jgi:Fibronectin type III domain
MRVLSRMLLILLAWVLLTGTSALMVTWDANRESDLAGYRLHYGEAPGMYHTRLDVGLFTSAVISGLSPGQRYYVAVTAYDTSGNESAYSQEVSQKAPREPYEWPCLEEIPGEGPCDAR